MCPGAPSGVSRLMHAPDTAAYVARLTAYMIPIRLGYSRYSLGGVNSRSPMFSVPPGGIVISWPRLPAAPPRKAVL
jgi:hypothetical protein